MDAGSVQRPWEWEQIVTEREGQRIAELHRQRIAEARADGAVKYAGRERPCLRCGERLPVSAFYSKHSTYCKSCQGQYTAARRRGQRAAKREAVS